MFKSIVDDVKYEMRFGNTISKLIVVNITVFILIVLVKVFSAPATGFYSEFLGYLALPGGSFATLLSRPWTIFTHMFLHEGFWHIAWNMLMLYWFGRIVGDLIGDSKILSIYILGGVAGAAFYLIFSFSLESASLALGASAAVMAFVVSAGFISPNYNMALVLIGDVKLKYVVLFILLLDVFLLSQNSNSGGRIAHFGGAVFGGLYVYLLQQGIDLTNCFNSSSNSKKITPVKNKNSLRVVHRSTPDELKAQNVRQEKVDEILEKISKKGFDKLTEEEKEYLYLASKES